MTQIAVFASGGGTNAQNLINNLTRGRVNVVLCNNPKAYVLERARNENIPAYTFTRDELVQPPTPERPNRVVDLLEAYHTDLIILAGFLLHVPSFLIDQYHDRIINIHPALLPKYGGKGMYGHHVHEAVVAAHETQSGITIHLVDNDYDHGRTLFQATCSVTDTDSPETLAQKIHLLEQAHFPNVVDQYIETITHHGF